MFMLYNIIFLGLMVIILSFIYAGLRAAPWIPAWQRDLERIIKLAEIKPGQIFYDLGCGDGRVVCAAAKNGARAIGFEISLFQYFLACLRVAFSKGPKAKIIFKDFWDTDLSQADIVYFFLMPKAYFKLQAKLKRELKPGAKVIAYVWPIKQWEPAKVDKISEYPVIYSYKL
jgi:SAM-dependent methyltransferase